MVDEDVKDVVEGDGDAITTSCMATPPVAVLEDELAVGDFGDAHTSREKSIVVDDRTESRRLCHFIITHRQTPVSVRP